MQVYVTRHKLGKVLRSLKFVEKQAIEDRFKKHFFMMSDRDLSYYSVLHTFLSDPKRFANEKLEKWVDTYTFVIEQNPAYHKDNECKWLQSNFDNFYIPSKVKEAKLIDKIRNIAENRTYKYNFNDKAVRESFIKECISYFLENHKLSLTVEDFVPTDFDNSGYELIENDVNILQTEIKEILERAKGFFNEYENKHLLENYRSVNYIFGKSEYKYDKGYIEYKTYTKLAYIRRNFYNRLKPRIPVFLFEKYNPLERYDDNILQILEFKPCKSCFGH